MYKIKKLIKFTIFICLLSACGSESADRASQDEQDTTAPTVDSDITFTNVTSSQIQIEVSPANDAVTAQASLEYKFVTAATTAEIDTLAEVEALSGGAILQDWTANQTSVTAESLNASTSYCYAVVVRDAAANQALYTPACQTTAIPTFKIFLTTSVYDGNLGGVSGADAKCNADANKPAGGASYKALISDDSARKGTVSAQVDWPLQASTTYVRADGTTVIGVTTAQAVFTLPLTNSITGTAGGAHTGIDPTTWDSTGTTNCLAWTSNSGLNYGETGVSNSTSNTAFNNFDPGCSFTAGLYCVEQP